MSEKGFDSELMAKALIVATCILCGTYLLANEVPGAGWLIFVAVLVLL